MMSLRKVLALLLSLAVMLALAACGGENTPPQITGVMDQTVGAGTEFDALAGVQATDKEDGDITGRMMIDATPQLIFKNGKTTIEMPGSYELVYSVTDKAGETVEAYATITVTRQAADATVYKEFSFDEQPVDARGWDTKIADGVAATAALKQGAYVFDIQNPGNSDSDIQLRLPNMILKAANYKIKVWAKSTVNTYAHVLARDEDADGWATFAGAYNLPIGQQISALELEFTAKKPGSTELLINLGKITPNPGEPTDTTPENFTVTIDKVEVYEITGNETQTPIYTNDFSADSDIVSLATSDGAVADVTYEDKAAKITIGAYPTVGEIWSIRADIQLPDVVIKEGQRYFYSFKVNAENAQNGECLVESAALGHEARVHFNSLAVSSGGETVVTGSFVADRSVADPVIRLQIGNAAQGVVTNTLTIDDVRFCLVEGDKQVKKTNYSFMPFGANTANYGNSNYPWQTYNGTDEDNARGVGTIWTENGSLFYRIDQGGVTDWHNKLMCGYGDNPLELKADYYYIVEITAKATKNVSCGVFLNELGDWKPIISQTMDITTQEQTFTFETDDTFFTDMKCEILFQFGSEATAALGEVTVEFSNITIYQRPFN